MILLKYGINALDAFPRGAPWAQAARQLIHIDMVDLI
jgi:hypothetical protein